MAQLLALELARIRLRETLGLLSAVSKGGDKLEYVSAEHYAALRELYFAVSRTDAPSRYPGIRTAYDAVFGTAVSSAHSTYDPTPDEGVLPDEMSDELRAEIAVLVGETIAE